MDTNELNELDIKLNLYDEICREFEKNNWGKYDWETKFATREIIKHLGDEIAFSCRIEDLLFFLADEYGLDSNCMVVSSRFDISKTIGDYSQPWFPRYFSKYELTEKGIEKIYKRRIFITGYSEMPQHQILNHHDGKIGNIGFYKSPIRRRSDLFVNCEPCFTISIDSLFDFAEPQADGKPLLEHFRVYCSTHDEGERYPKYRHTSELILESDPYDVFLHIPVSFLANERSKNSTTYQLLSSYFESVQEKEAAVEKKKA